MSIFKLLRQFSVTVKADCRGRTLDQPGLIRGMGIMAAQAFTPLNRCMHYTLELISSRIGMAGVTQFLYFILE
jgi:hypothetical protein